MQSGTCLRKFHRSMYLCFHTKSYKLNTRQEVPPKYSKNLIICRHILVDSNFIYTHIQCITFRLGSDSDPSFIHGKESYISIRPFVNFVTSIEKY
jgi:hypothetical protein